MKLGKIRRFGMSLFAAAGLLVASSALARTTPASVGMAYFNNDANCFADRINNGDVGVRNTCAVAKGFSIPVAWDTPGAKTISVRGWQSVANALTCTYFGTSSATGTVTPQVSFGAFTVGAASTRTINVNVVAGTLGTVYCFMGANSTARVAGIDYTP